MARSKLNNELSNKKLSIERLKEYGLMNYVSSK